MTTIKLKAALISILIFKKGLCGLLRGDSHNKRGHRGLLLEHNGRVKHFNKLMEKAEWLVIKPDIFSQEVVETRTELKKESKYCTLIHHIARHMEPMGLLSHYVLARYAGKCLYVRHNNFIGVILNQGYLSACF